MATWTRIFPSGAWQVCDERTYVLGQSRWTTYYGYSKRDAMRAHAEYVRSLKRSS